MTLYVSKHPGFSLQIHEGAFSLQDVVLPNGVVQQQHVPVSPYMSADFRSRIADTSADEPFSVSPPVPYALEVAKRYFEPRNRNSAGEPATGPYREDRLIRIDAEAWDENGNQVVIEQEVYTQGSDVTSQFSWFDTEDPAYYPVNVITSRLDPNTGESILEIPPMVKQLYEARLSRFAGTDGRYIKIEPEAIPKPWPKYDELKTAQGITKEKVVERILHVADQIGVDLREVRSYEAAHEARDYVLDALDQKLNRRASDAAEIEALSAPA